MTDTNTKPFFPYQPSIGAQEGLYDGQVPQLQLTTGLTVLVGPNAAGKTVILKALRDHLRRLDREFAGKRLVFLSAGRSTAFEPFRSSANAPNSLAREPAALGHQSWMQDWWQIEGAPGMMMRLKDRSDLLLKVEARLQSLYNRIVRLQWGQRGLEVQFRPAKGGKPYFANVEASGLIQLIPLLAALYDDEIYALLIDEPEISLHPQLQAFLLQEIRRAAGDPRLELSKKVIVLATHSPSLLPVRRISDVANLIFFTDGSTLPVQVPSTAGELANRKLSALIVRMTESHKLAFFARNVLLVEGPSDEIMVTGISVKLDHSLLGANTQLVPINGKGQFSPSIKLFRLMGKKVFVLADLDAFADDNELINCFQTEAEASVHGFANLADMDRCIRKDFAALLDKDWKMLEPLASGHSYVKHVSSEEDPQKARRRAALATLLNLSAKEICDKWGEQWRSLRTRFDTLLATLSNVGCVVLRRGTIEDYFRDADAVATASSGGKPEGAAIEVEYLTTLPEEEVREIYDDLVSAIQISAPLQKIDEALLLREQLVALLGPAMLVAAPGMTDDELNTRAVSNVANERPVFKLTNKTRKARNGGTLRAVSVEMRSPLFVTARFPFELNETENLVTEIEKRLPSKD